LKKFILYFISLILLLFSSHQAFAQDQKFETKYYNGVFAEYTTLILLTHNLKLYSDLNYFKSEKVILSIQPGVEFIYSIPGAERTYNRGSPYYDINLLGAITLFPNYGISIKPFFGISYRFKANAASENSSEFNIKYGSTLQLNIARGFSIIGKIMNIPTNHSSDVSVLLGVGFAFKLF